MSLKERHSRISDNCEGAASLRPPYRDIDWDDALEKTPEGAAVTTRGALNIERWLRVRAPSTVLTLAIVEGFHRTIFEGLFPDFAGRLRGPHPRYIPTDVEFGNNRGTRHMDVPEECRALLGNVAGLIGQLDTLQGQMDSTDFAAEVLKVAAYLHCELIRIHPFANGNGRTARACINYFAWRYGMRPLPIGRPGGEYLEANQTWFQQKILDHMIDYLKPRWQPR